ncbi:MAG: hypothetical protein AAFP19_11005 [Bacteroidota bacterium]
MAGFYNQVYAHGNSYHMESYDPRATQREDRLVKDVHLLIDLKMKNIENKTNRLIQDQLHSLDTDRTISINWNIYNLSKIKAVFSRDDRILGMIEKYSIGINRLLRLRSSLNRENASRVIDLLSNDKFLLCSEKSVFKALGQPVAIRML